MQIITLAELPATPWRNGGGQTRALAAGNAAGTPVHPDRFDWRISLADIDTDGPFSTFPGLDRHALLIGNGAVELAGPSGAVMARAGLPISFPGELELDARRQPGTDHPRFLNLMVRRKALRGEIVVVTQRCRVEHAVAWALVPLRGAWQAGRHRIDVGQALQATAGDVALTPQAGDACAALVTVRPLP